MSITIKENDKLAKALLDECVMSLNVCKYSVHLKYDWLNDFFRVFLNEQNAKLLQCIGPNRTSIGFLPVQILTIRGTRFFSLRRLAPLGLGPSDFFDIPCLPQYVNEAMESLVRWLETHSRSWDSLFLNLIPETSLSWQPLVNALSRHKFRLTIEDQLFFYKY